MNHQIYPGELNLNALPSLLNKPNPVILDIGTNNGGHTKAFFDLFPYGSIYSFEPDPRAIRKFHANLALYARAKLYEIAIADKDGTTTFYASGGQNADVNYIMPEGWDMSGSIRKPKDHLITNPSIKFEDSFEVTTQKLDTWVAQNNIQNIDFIWADVQGAEIDLIRGGLDSLQKKTKYFYTEYSNREMYEGQVNLDGILSILTNFSIHTQFEYDVLLQNNTLI